MSAITESIRVGVTRDDSGVPLGLVNWMILNQKGLRPRLQRIGKRTGYLWFIIRIKHLLTNTHIWTDL